MKKLTIMILCVLFALTGCSFPLGSDLERNANHPTQTAQPTLNPQSGNQHQITVPLYFQYSNEGYLSSEIYAPSRFPTPFPWREKSSQS